MVNLRGVGRALIALALGAPSVIAAQRDSSIVAKGDSVSVRLVDVDLRAAVQALAQYLDRPVVFGSVPASRVTFETPRAVPRADILRLLRGLVESQNLELHADTIAGLYRVRAREIRPLGVFESQGPAAQGGPIELFVIRLRHARVADVAATVNALYGRASALGEIGGRQTTLGRELRENVVRPQEPPGSQPAALVSSVAGRTATLSGEIVVVPDASTNSLLIRANRADFALIQAAVKELDVRPLQVLIEVLIAEIRRDRSLAFGVDAQAKNVDIPGTTKPGTITQTGLGLGDFALQVMGIGGLDINATLRAAASRGDATIVSRPIVIAANNEDAEILVGSQRPFVQVSRSLPTDAPSRDQVVQYKDVGTRLIVRPTISADGYVMLEVTQEVNAATAETQFDAPVISTRTVQTRLLVKDGQTVVLGGLSDQQKDRNQSGVPFLSSIPWIGGLFGRASRRSTDTELFLFITPRVIYSDSDATEVTEPLRKRASQAKP